MDIALFRVHWNVLSWRNLYGLEQMISTYPARFVILKSQSGNKKGPGNPGPVRVVIWWRGGDLNSRPSGYEP